MTTGAMREESCEVSDRPAHGDPLFICVARDGEALEDLEGQLEQWRAQMIAVVAL